VTTDWSLPLNGTCRCGQLRIRATAAPILTMACHCRGCQRMSASAYSLTAMFPTDHFAITEGEPVIGGLHGEHRHFFCSHCKSWVLTRPRGVEQFINVRPTMFDDVSWFVPFIETYVSEKLPWANTPARHSFEKFPEISDYAGLVAGYAEHVSKSN
jgi:hypothetical protein